MTECSIVQNILLRELPYELISLRDESGTLTLELVGSNGAVTKITFNDYLFFSKQDEGDSLRTLQELRSALVLGKSVLVQAKCSSLLKWFFDESFNVRNPDDLEHYIIISVNDVMNVVCSGLPEISLI